MIRSNFLRPAAWLTATLLLSLPTFAMPPMGGPMKHLAVTLDGTTVGVVVQGDPTEALILQRHDDTQTGAAAVLNGQAINAQYGWLAGGFIALPPDGAVWVRRIAQSDGLSVYNAGTFVPILGTDGSADIWRWSGVMTHNWYAATEPGRYEATYEVYIGDASGALMVDYTPTTVTLHWLYPCAQDLDGDGAVGLGDLGSMFACWGQPCGDISGDGETDLADLGEMFANWGCGQ